jgi:hypothetical protein
VAIVEHTLRPRGLAAPLNRHSREDELSIVLTGRMGALLGQDVVEADGGAYVWKPRDKWHTFWNASGVEAAPSICADPCRSLAALALPAAPANGLCKSCGRPVDILWRSCRQKTIFDDLPNGSSAPWDCSAGFAPTFA